MLITHAGGVHAGPLAEFAVLGLLAFTKGLPRLLANQRAHRWGHYPMTELADATLLIVGSARQAPRWRGWPGRSACGSSP